MKRLAAATVLAFSLSAAGAVSASATTAARLAGTFVMKGRITLADNVRGEHAGQRITRSWTFFPQCTNGACRRVLLKRLRSARGIVDTVMLSRRSAGVYSGRGRFSVPLKCNGQVLPHGGVANERITVRITHTAPGGGTLYATGVSARYDNPSRHQYTRCPGAIGRDGATYAGTLAVKAIAATPNAGYLILSAAGTTFHFGRAASHGFTALPFRRHAVGMAVDQSTGGYWILDSNGGVQSFGAPWKGSLAGKLHGTRPVAIAASGSGGYLILTSDGGVRPFGDAAWHGSHKGKLARGVHAVSLAVNASGDYWVLNSNGAVAGFGTPSLGSMRGKLSGRRAAEIATARNGGYLILTGDGGVHPFGNATFYGSEAGKLAHGVSAVSMALDPKTAGYWLLMSKGGVKGFHAPWEGSLR